MRQTNYGDIREMGSFKGDSRFVTPDLRLDFIFCLLLLLNYKNPVMIRCMRADPIVLSLPIRYWFISLLVNISITVRSELVASFSAIAKDTHKYQVSYEYLDTNIMSDVMNMNMHIETKCLTLQNA